MMERMQGRMPMAALENQVHPHPNLIERRGGWILSAGLHVIFFASLLLVRPEPVAAPRAPRPIFVSLAAPAATVAPTPAAVVAKPETMVVEPAAATMIDTPVVDPAAAVVAVLPTVVPEKESEPAAGADIKFNAIAATEPMEISPADSMAKSKARAAGEAANFEHEHEHDYEQAKAVGEAGTAENGQSEAIYALQGGEGTGRGSQAVAQRLQLARADLAAQKTLFNSPGKNEGAIREIDTSDVADSVAQEVLARYGINIMIAKLNQPAVNPPGYINGATMRSGRFVNAHGKGVYQVFTFGPPAVAKMAQLEEAAIRKQGRDPRTVRVTRVVFGIVATTREYDLGVKKIEVEPIAGGKTAAD